MAVALKCDVGSMVLKVGIKMSCLQRSKRNIKSDKGSNIDKRSLLPLKTIKNVITEGQRET